MEAGCAALRPAAMLAPESQSMACPSSSGIESGQSSCPTWLHRPSVHSLGNCANGAPGTATDVPDISADRVSSPVARRGPSATTPLVWLSDESPAHHHTRGDVSRLSEERCGGIAQRLTGIAHLLASAPRVRPHSAKAWAADPASCKVALPPQPWLLSKVRRLKPGEHTQEQTVPTMELLRSL